MRDNFEKFTKDKRVYKEIDSCCSTGVLVAVSIPIFTSQLEKAREATDVANMRAAKAAAVTAYLNQDTTLGFGGDVTVNLNYDAQDGKLTKSAVSNKYGKGTAAKGGITAFMGYNEEKVAKDLVIKVTIDKDGNVTEEWTDGAAIS